LGIFCKVPGVDERQKMNSYSLRQRLLAWLLFPLLLIGLAALFDAYKSARTTADEISDRVLAGSALAIAERIFVNDRGTLDVDIPYVALEMLTSVEDDRVFYKVEGAEKTFITGYKELEIPEIYQRSENNINFADFEFRGFPIRVAVLNGAASSNTVSLSYRLAIAETINARSKMARDILVRSALRQGLLILTAALVVWFAVTRALLPLYKVQDALGRRTPDDLRPILHHVPNEIAGLVSTINDLLSKIGTNIAALRNFTSNASHQLRTPLTVMRTHLEIANQAKSNTVRRKALERADEAISDAEKIVSKLLVLARIDSGSLQDSSNIECDIAEIGKSVCADIISNPLTENIDLGFEGLESMMVRGDPVLLRELLKNLVENAIRHAGPDVRITVRCQKRHQIRCIEVEDNGVGLDDKQKTELMKRFSRGADYKDGAGIGLAISREIAELYGGALKLEDVEEGPGLKVCVYLKGQI
jgi:two-component system sensor histidine kinase TctE